MSSPAAKLLIVLKLIWGRRGFQRSREPFVEEGIRIQGRLPSPMPLNRFNAPAACQGQKAQRLHLAEFGHENVGRLMVIRSRRAMAWVSANEFRGMVLEPLRRGKPPQAKKK